MFAVLLQHDFRDFVAMIEKVIYVVVFIGAALIPVVQKAREKAAEAARARRKLEHPRERPSAPPREVEAERPMPQEDLEARLRRYFEQSGEEPAEEPAEEPRSAPAASRSAQRQLPGDGTTAAPAPARKVEHISRIEAMQSVSLAHDQLPSQLTRGRALAGGARATQRRVARDGRAAVAPLLRRLSSPAALREAILAREILGPPRGLEDFNARS